MKEYLVWDPERETEDEAGIYEASGFEEAARKYIEYQFDGAAYYQLLVKQGEDLYEVNVSIITEPVYKYYMEKV